MSTKTTPQSHEVATITEGNYEGFDAQTAYELQLAKYNQDLAAWKEANGIKADAIIATAEQSASFGWAWSDSVNAKRAAAAQHHYNGTTAAPVEKIPFGQRVKLARAAYRDWKAELASRGIKVTWWRLLGVGSHLKAAFVSLVLMFLTCLLLPVAALPVAIVFYVIVLWGTLFRDIETGKEFKNWHRADLERQLEIASK